MKEKVKVEAELVHSCKLYEDKLIYLQVTVAQ